MIISVVLGNKRFKTLSGLNETFQIHFIYSGFESLHLNNKELNKTKQLLSFINRCEIYPDNFSLV